MTPPQHPEIGRELLAHELRKRQIVWVTKQNRPAIMTMWVVEINESFVHLWSGDFGIELVLRRLPGGGVTDDSGLPMKLFEYLGSYPPEKQ
jgi:hypothetical protein